MSVVILLTGATGFLGKVVLEELFRLRSHSVLDFDQVVLLIRPTRKSASTRFWDEVASSICFSRLAKAWVEDVEVVSCDLTERNCGIDSQTSQELASRVTHVIHCAGSVAFEADTQETVAHNVTGSLNLLRLSQRCHRLQGMVSTSTAYVTPHTRQPITEGLWALPVSPGELYESLQGDCGDAVKGVLRQTGHPNMYTLAKCLTEHLLLERRGDVPL